MTRRIILFASVLFLSAVVAGVSLPVQGQSAQEEEETTLTGCLNKGEEEGSYTLTDPETGDKITVTGSADLAPHANNHTVRLTGTMSEEADGKVFNATKVEHVEATCKAPTE